ncbi:MAG TPA: hypothetical protein VJR89_19670, partial [Polyangiales bacterium]|nr:hypothetical protein [Polyangiales bacterium]
MDGQRAVGSRRWAVGLGLLVAVVFTLNARWLSFGWFGDDYVHRRILLEHVRPWWNLFDDRRPALASADDPVTLFGRLPWWTSPRFSFALLRPLSAASQSLDYALWPSSPEWMHLHNVALFALIVCVAGALYRRWLLDPLACWIALGAYAIDDAHTVGNVWIASRNTLLVALFGLIALWSFDRARHDRARWAGWLAPLALLCAHASSEGAIALWAYLIAYALFLDTRGRRWLALLPLLAVSAGYYALAAAYGYGVRGSGLYVDPRTEPLRFVLVALARLPEIAWLQFGVSNLAFEDVPPAAFVPTVWAIRALVLAALAIGVWPSRRSRATRFFVLAAALALLPHCAIGASDRLLYSSGFAAHGVIGIALASCLRQLAAAGAWRRVTYAVLAA